MSEQFDEQISQFIDDEMSAQECEFFVRRLQRDNAARTCFQRYQLIGAALRREHEPLNRALGDGRVLASTGQRQVSGLSQATPWPAGRRLGLAAGMAAGIALAAVFGLQIFGSGLDRIGAGDEAVAADNSIETGRDSDSVLEARMPFPSEAEETGMQYLIHHTGYSARLPRTIMRSGFVAAPVTSSMDTGVDPLE